MDNIITIKNIIYLTILLLLFYGPWQTLLVFLLRQKLFEFRDYLFLLGADGELDYNSSSYKLLREKINLLIRYAHKLDWFSMLVSKINIYIFLKIDPQIKLKPSPTLEELITQVNNVEIREAIFFRLRRILMILSLVFVLRSVLLSVLSIFIAPFLLINAFLFNHELGNTKNKTLVKKKFNHLQDVLEEEEEFERYAAA